MITAGHRMIRFMRDKDPMRYALSSVSRGFSAIPLRSHILTVILIAVVAFFSYSNTFRAGFNFDDIDGILINTLVKSNNTGFWDIMLSSRRAIGQLSFVMNYRIGGTNVFGYHLVNLLIHVLTASLLYRLVLVTCEAAHAAPTTTRGDFPTAAFRDQDIAVFSALLFVAHPIQTQAVTYIVQRFTSLCTLFYLATILCYALARRTAEEYSIENGSKQLRVWGYITASLVCAILAVMTKEIAFTLPIMVLIYEFMFFRTHLQQRMKYLLFPVAVPISLACLMIFRTLQDTGMQGLHELTKIQTNISRIDYLFTQFRVIMTYIRLIFFPVNQNIDYDYPIYTAFTGEVALSALALGMLILTALWLWIRSNGLQSATDAPYLRLMAFGIIWFFVTLSIESSLIPIVDVIFEHRLYLPSVGALIAITAAVMFVAERFAASRNIVMLTLVATILILAIATFRRNAVWADELTLWQDAYLKAPRKVRVINNYAAALTVRGNGAIALPLLIKAIEISPGYFASWNNLPRAFGQIPLLRGHYWKGFEMVGPDGDVNPAMVTKWYSNALNNLGLAYQLQNNAPKAFDSYRKSLEVNPSFSLARENAMALLSALPDKAQAARYLEQLRRIPSK